MVEVAPAVFVICCFITYYGIWDVMAAGLSKKKYGLTLISYDEQPVRMPEEVFLAERAQMNQVEQMPVFLIGTLGCAFMVNGKVAAVMSFFWSILRLRYVAVYRQSVGLRWNAKGLGTYTVPCYFLSNGMVMATAIQCLRIILVSL